MTERPYQVLPDLSEEEYQALKKDIDKNGVQVDVAVDEEGNVIDGHHRVKACEELGIDKYPRTVYPGLSEQEKRDLAYKLNMQRRQVSDTAKIDVAKQYLLNDWDGKETQKSIADMLGCSKALVSKAFNSEDVFSAKDGVETAFNGEQSSSDSGDENNTKPTRLRADSRNDVEKIKTVKDKAKEGDEKAKEAWEGLQSGDESSSSAYESIQEDTDESDIDQFTSQETDEWSSPREVVEPINEAIDGFDLDPCSGAEESPFASDTFTEKDNGLTEDWYGRVWVNPPYSDVAQWIDKAIKETTRNAHTIVLLCKGDSSTDWWQRATEHSQCVVAIDRRLKFGGGENSAPFPSHIFVFGEVERELIDHLRTEGKVLTQGWNQ